MSNYYKKNKVHQDPQYYKKSKPSKRTDDEYYDYSDTALTYGGYNDIPKTKSVTFKKHHDIARKSVSFYNHYESPKDTREHASNYKRTYDSDTEYETDYEDYWGSDDDECYDSEGNKTRCRVSKRDKYLRIPPRIRKNKYSETETMIEDDSNSDYSLWETPRDRRVSLNKEYNRGNNLYNGHTRNKYRHSRDSIDSEMSLYRSEVSVYSVHDHKGLTPYRYKRKESKQLYETDDETASDTEMQGDSATTLSQSQYHIYNTQIPKNTPFSRERLISVIDYNQDTSLPKQKNKTTNKIDITNSGYVYIPVILRNKPTTKVNSTSELKMEKPIEEGKLQNNVKVFVADNLEQKNVFQQNTSNIKNKEPSPNFSKRKSKMSTSFKKTSSKSKKLEDNENDYPVKKAYINVAPNDKSNSKFKTSESKKSKSSLETIKKKQSKESELKTDKQPVEKKGKNQDSSTALNDGPTKLNDNQTKRSGILKDRKDDVPTTVIHEQKSPIVDTSNVKSNSKKPHAEDKTKNNSDINAERKCDVSIKESRNVSDTGKQQRHRMGQKGSESSHEVPENSDMMRKSKSSTKKGKHLSYSSLQSTDSKCSDSENPTTDDPVKLWGYDITPLVYAFQTAQFFLGLSMHDVLMDIANQYYTN